MALQLLHQGDSQEIQAKVLVNVACLIEHWQKPIRESYCFFGDIKVAYKWEI
ncbi:MULTISPECIES: hypothetical protein [Planktothricoides]|uniref:Uncharacterized protein n=2 Tax=Planktothricoides raciborskii TaxID=132608 RepID=A0AAU8JET7_9CYAN|nr:MULTISPECIES: hypothetical protein [Planktothricoides]MBD2547351.1 hypothetical protein [Planktothricoides raciborskii FACHB-1370]MBD2585850.1 hypothetical protein [Planktothricoides raciborskii FACHB-1261]